MNHESLNKLKNKQIPIFNDISDIKDSAYYDMMIDICKFSSELETDNDDIFYYDNMDVGFYVKCNDTIFQINKRENTSIIYDKRGNKYNVKDCEPLTKKEIRPYKISKLLNA